MGDGTMQAKDEFVTPQKPRSRTPDDSANPYDERLSRWAPVSPSAKLWLSSRLIVKPVSAPGGAAFEAARLLEDVYAAHSDDPGFAVFEITSEATRAGYAAGRLIHETGVPILRRFLEGVLVHVGGFSPRAVHAVLDDWRTYLPDTVFVDEIDGGSESNSHVYGLRPLNEPNVSDLPNWYGSARKS